MAETQTLVNALEHREYGPDSSPEERALIRDRVSLYRPHVIYWHEVPVMSVWQVQEMGEQFSTLAARLDRYHLLINLTEARPPNARIRAALRQVFAPTSASGLDRCAVFTDRNYFISVAAKFVLGGAGLKARHRALRPRRRRGGSGARWVTTTASRTRSLPIS